MPPPIRIKFFFDIGSPYTYFALEILLRYERRWNIVLDLRPVLLGAVFKITGNVSPALSSQYKAAYMMTDLDRVSKEYQIPFHPGPEFPGNTREPMRMLRYLKDDLPPAKFREATRHYFRENFVKNTPLSSPEFLHSLAPTIISDAKLKQALTEYKTVTDKMKIESAKVVEDYGAFGFPWIVVERSPSLDDAPGARGDEEAKEVEVGVFLWFG
ncbi:SubName: Full=Uncharacterized protein {ECO:0000313/EMBL:KIM26898.1} [Serendipita indica DSM 11827]|nr:SubName: Full=Uncharacterized protein {ECO:0000313/EMBL:KIM26898.1} [Serendipita indica DSM 11827]